MTRKTMQPPHDPSDCRDCQQYPCICHSMSEQTREGLKPCPFCGGDAPIIDKVLRDGYADFKDDPDAYAYSYRCHACAAEGGWAKSESGARRWWNTRAPASLAQRSEPVGNDYPAAQQIYERARDLAEETMQRRAIRRASSPSPSSVPIDTREGTND